MRYFLHACLSQRQLKGLNVGMIGQDSSLTVQGAEFTEFQLGVVESKLKEVERT